MRTLTEIKRSVARRLWRLASGYQFPLPPRPPVREGGPAPRSLIPRNQLRHHPFHAGAAHPSRWEFPAWLGESPQAWLRALRDLYAMPVAFPASLSPEAGLLLHALVRNIRPRVVIETGTFIGVSTIWIAAALEEGATLHAFDLFEPIGKGYFRDAEMAGPREEFVRERLERAGVGARVRLHKGDSPHEIRRMHEELRSAGGVQLAFLDGDHEVEGAWLDFAAVEPVLNTGGYVLLHDVFPEFCGWSGPRDVVNNRGYRAAGIYQGCDVCLSPVNYGMTVLRRMG